MFTASRDQFRLGNLAINLLAPYPFSTLNIFIKTRSSFDNMLFVYQHALTQQFERIEHLVNGIRDSYEI